MTLKISMRETTQNSLHKIYNYRIRKVSENTEVERDGEIIVYKFITKIKSI
jgi:hypothetical protein